MIDLIAAAGIGGITVGGSLVYLAMKEKVDDTTSLRRELVRVNKVKDHRTAQGLELIDAHTRCSDALETARNRIERALTCETPKAAHGVKKMARLLRGDEA